MERRGDDAQARDDDAQRYPAMLFHQGGLHGDGGGGLLGESDFDHIPVTILCAEAIFLWVNHIGQGDIVESLILGAAGPGAVGDSGFVHAFGADLQLLAIAAIHFPLKEDHRAL